METDLCGALWNPPPLATKTDRRCRFGETHLRNQEHREQRLGSYELFQRSTLREHAVWDKIMRGLSTRNYGAVVKEFREAYGVEKSAVSDSFIEVSRGKLQELMERPLGELRLCRCG
jgi:putative transposase